MDITACKKEFSKFGYVVLEEFFDSGAVDEIARRTDFFEQENIGNRYYDDGILSRVERVLDDACYKNLIMTEKMNFLLEQLLDDKPALFKDKINFKLPNSRSDEIHQDHQAGWGKYADYFVSITIAVDKNTIENACLKFPDIGSYQHRKTCYPEWRPFTEEEIRSLSLVYKPLNPGDLVIFDSYVPHGSERNTSNMKRRNIYLTFGKASSGDFRERYYQDKLKTFPPNDMRDENSDQEYRYRV